jgi:glycosyltransferase involved in cell wall biosynthesis
MAGRAEGESMRVSILIPTFNRADLLVQAIESALAQTHKQLEIIVIDDGSSDNTPGVGVKYGTAIRYLRKQNGGKASALNLGISASAGDVIIVLDDDDLLPSYAISKHVEALLRNPSAGFSFGRFVRFRGSTLPEASKLIDHEVVPIQDPRRLLVKLMESCFLPNPTFAVRRDAQMQIGLYDATLNFNEDYDMILRLARKLEGSFVDNVVLYQRKHLAHRGPRLDPTFTTDTVDKWIKYDAILFNRIDREWDLMDFYPFASNISADQSEPLAALQKGIILFQRKVYAGAIGALTQYRRSLVARSPTQNELRIATGLLGCRYGIADIVAETRENNDLIIGLRGQRWPILLRAAFATQIRWRVRAALKAKDLNYAAKLLRFSLRAFGVGAGLLVGSRYGVGSREWQCAPRR